MQKVLYLMTVSLIISVGNADTPYKHQRSKRNDINKCLNNCQNGGNFTNNDGCFTCICADGWTGDHCYEDIDECMDDPCLNGATCTNTHGSFTCTCNSEWTGITCDKVLQNIALGKPAEQSLKSSPFRAEYAVDGNRGTDFEKDKCSFAGSEQHNWWMVDLQTVYSIKTVRMLNMGYPYEPRYHMFLSWLRNVTVTVGLTKSDVNTPCAFFEGPASLSELVVIDCPTLPQGRFVKISSKNFHNVVLCEVDVFGFPI